MQKHFYSYKIPIFFSNATIHLHFKVKLPAGIYQSLVLPFNKNQPFHFYHSKTVFMHISCFIYIDLMFIKALIFHAINLWWDVMFAASAQSSPWYWSACVFLSWEIYERQQTLSNPNLTTCETKYGILMFSSHPNTTQIWWTHVHQSFLLWAPATPLPLQK